jgi:hypothetical protein
VQRLSGTLIAFIAALAAPMMAETITPAAGSIQASVLIDGSANIIDMDFRTPFGGGVMFPVGTDQIILTDNFASGDFGNKTLFGFDSPAQNSTFNFTFDAQSGSFSGGTFFVNGSGALLTGSAIPAVAPFLNPLDFTFAVNSTAPVPDSQFFLVTAFVTNAQTSTVPEPGAFFTCSAALLVAGLIRFRRRPHKPSHE